MYKDAREELKRLEEALLEEEVPQAEEEEDEDVDVDEDVDALLAKAEEILGTEDTQVVMIPRVYNTDHVDTDLDRYSEEVHSGKQKRMTGFVILAIALALGIAAVVIYWIVRYGGMLL